MKVFLGGTCNESLWRNELIKKLEIDYYNPVVPDWTEDAYERELKERMTADFCLYVITPKATGVYSIAEVIDDSNKRPTKTIFCFLPEDKGMVFTKGQTKSLTATGKMVENNGGYWFKNLDEISNFLNSQSKKNLTYCYLCNHRQVGNEINDWVDGKIIESICYATEWPVKCNTRNLSGNCKHYKEIGRDSYCG